MRTLATILIFALAVAGLWGPDGLANAQDDCVSQSAVSAGETALAFDCKVLLDARDILLGTVTQARAADTPIEDWEEFKYTLEEAALRDITTDPPIEAKHYYESPPSLNWAADLPIEDWDGITVDGTPRRVVGISLRYERLPGSIPKGLGNLTGLKRLHLGGNQLTGPVPSELGYLSSLTSLHLDGNGLSGSIPAQLGGLSNLTELFVDSNRLTGEIPGSFTNLANLTDFRFWGNEGLCAPTDEAFRAWLQAIDYVDGSACDFAADRAVLVKFFDSTDGPNWRRSYGWLSDLPMGEWHGVETDDEGRVTRLNLWENGLSGQIPAELGELSNLDWLSLSENQLSGPVPPELGDLSNLKGLFFSRNQLSGPLPPELGDLSRLEALSLRDNQLTGEIPSELGGLLGLNSLYLGGNQLSGQIPSELGDLSRLNSLNLEDNLLSGQIPSELGGLLRLELLHLGGNQLSGRIPSELGSFSHMRSLDLSGNRLDGEIPQELGDLSRLRSLHLSENLLTGEFPESFVGMPLWRLDFYNNQTLCVPVADEFQSWLDGIDTVRGSSCAPADSQQDKAILALLYSATNGENWKDNSNWLSGRPIREWYGVTNDADGRVTGLYLSDNQMSGAIPPEMGDLSQLQWLYLQQNELTGQVPRSFLNLANLTSFYFSDNAGLCAPVDKEFQDWLQGIREAEGGSCNPVADLNVLAMLYNTTDGENWKDNSNWLSDRPMSEWYGVQTDDEGHVTVLDLHWNWLSGTIPQELGRLSSLEELDLEGNGLGGTIPRELGNLGNLARLSLAYNSLTGEIPPELGDLSNLEELELWENELTGTIPRELASLANLTSLHLGGNQLTGEIPPVLGNLSNLEELGLRDNQLTGTIPTQLGNLSSLEYLGLGYNQLTGTIPDELGNLSNLTWLSIWNNQLTGTIPRSFTGLSSLTRLEFWNNAGLCAPNDEVFQAWLQDIVIVYGEACDFAPDRDVLVGFYNAMDGDNWDESGNWLTDRPMGEWNGVGTDNSGRVTWLSLSRNQLTGEIPPELDNLSNLTWLDLDHNQLTGTIPTQLGNLSNLEYLGLGDNHLTGEIPPELGNLSNLARLNLSDNQLTGTIPTQLGNLSNLTRLKLDHNQLTGTIPTQLGNLSNLIWLTLDHNQLTGTIPMELGNLTDLILLYFGSNQLSGTIPTQLGNLTDLSVLSLSYNHLTGEFPDSLTGLTQLRTLSYHGNIGLCAPVSDSFQTWLQGIVTVTGSSCAPVDSREDRTVLAKLYDATDGANWKDSFNWLSDRPIREWHGVTNDANGRVIGLYLGENGLSGPIPPELGDLSNLRRLTLQENQLSGSIPPELGNLSVLVSLSLNSNQLTGSIPPELGNLSSLEWLSLNDNQLTGSIPPELGNLSNLEWLSLKNNQLTGSIPPELGNLPNLIWLYLIDNQITGCIPASLDHFFFLTYLTDLHLLGLPTCGIPTVTMNVDTASYQVRIGSPIPVTATFSEPVEGFTESDVTVANGYVGNFSGSDGDSVFTFDVTPNAVGVVTVDITAGVTQSYDGNGNTAAVQLDLGLPYDDDHDGAISSSEVLRAVADYFNDRLTAQHVLQIVALYFG